MYEPNSLEDELAKRILKEIRRILEDIPYPNVTKVVKESVGATLECEQINIDLGHGHSLHMSLYKKVK